jgi:hypothetical protein
MKEIITGIAIFFGVPILLVVVLYCIVKISDWIDKKDMQLDCLAYFFLVSIIIVWGAAVYGIVREIFK